MKLESLTIPTNLTNEARSAQDWLCQYEANLPEAVKATLPAVWVASHFIARQLTATPGLLDDEFVKNLVHRYNSKALAAKLADAIAECSDEDALLAKLRNFRNHEMLRIAWRDLAGWAPLSETLRDLSAIGDACLNQALDKLSQWHKERYGELLDETGQAQQLIVLGMGKLGAGELNFSSDVDLIFAYAERGESNGKKSLAAEDYFTRLARKLIRALDAPTADGFVFRVDTRLRPFGDSGPLVMSFTAMEQYYQQHGREWERYAFIKARPVAGNHAAGSALLDLLRPFVYRRYLDYGVFESLRSMKESIIKEVRRLDLDNNIKLGAGGIREIEFIGQVYQLIRGGREPRFRERGIRRILRLLAEAEHLEQQDVDDLQDAYVFLRRLENRLQMVDDLQTHDIPEDSVAQARLAFAMGYSHWNECTAALDEKRQRVHAIFQQLIVTPRDEARHHADEESLANVWSDENASQAVLQQAGFSQPEMVQPALTKLRQAGDRLGEQGQARLNALMPAVLQAAAQTETPAMTLTRLAEILDAVMRRTSYLALLLESPQALAHLARLCAASQWLASLVAAQPLLLDELIDPRIFQTPPAISDYAHELEVLLQRTDATDLERQMDALREFQQVSAMRVVAADISGILPIMRVSDHLTAIAEQVIAKVLELSRRHLGNRHGEPRCRDEAANEDRPVNFLIVAYGKLGGIELGYSSDLDLVFLHDSMGEEQHTDGEKPLENPVYFLRLTQRLIHLLSTPTAAGVLYDVDTRLRPSGSSGLLVTSLAAFEHYQRQSAWTWERQALLRARPVAGDIALGEQFWRLRRELLCRPPDVQTLTRDVVAMRERMRRETGRAPDAAFDIKQDAGGLTDLEFLVQYLVLRHAHNYPDLVDYPDIIRFVDGLQIHGLLPPAQCDGLVNAYRAYRDRVHQLALQDQAATAGTREFSAERDCVRDLWEQHLANVTAQP
ncbi:MAG TPA: bifunctional [glutamate--ammonia ligase]-adenylyl-L-tyrosine phosphorylase/[glutamate--ammonia-ligase] adenylyltransferase [Gammaproteobacteria bacterium]|nr:bifunctional [glutamate--ammonia ligase]-adenylyl-L-tyrosine phosphorylase/[glutamate--ammonia-ligase] adenylyltransferase [Gammaproteobacteria bacterium]